MGRGKVKGLIERALLLMEGEDYQALYSLLEECKEELKELSPEEARELHSLLTELSKRLKLKEKELLKALENRKKVRDSYGKCSL